jgi:enoyl-CoA hydratase
MTLPETPLLAEAPVLIRVDGGVGRLTLNRPRALHALNTQMCRLMTQALQAWRDDDGVACVLLDHTGERGFCAGGDIRMIARSGAADRVEALEFFATEYRLNALLFNYPKPIIAIMDGVVMGGGVGISAPAQYRVVTERTMFAMPETGIGLFPDVGGGWFLPRLPGRSGTWLGLTGARLGGSDCLFLGLATHHVESAQIEGLKAALLDPRRPIGAALAEVATAPADPPLAQHQSQIAATFGGDSVENIFAALERDGSPWAQAQLNILGTKSPQALKVTLRQLRAGEAMARFEDELTVEYRLATRICSSPDFQEGVRAVIVDKDNAPHWTPARLSEVGSDLLDRLFAPLAPQDEWTAGVAQPLQMDKAG